MAKGEALTGSAVKGLKCFSARYGRLLCDFLLYETIQHIIPLGSCSLRNYVSVKPLETRKQQRTYKRILSAQGARAVYMLLSAWVGIWSYTTDEKLNNVFQSKADHPRMCVFSYARIYSFCFCDLDLDPMTLIRTWYSQDMFTTKSEVSRQGLSKVGARTGQTNRRDRTHYQPQLLVIKKFKKWHAK